MKFKGRRVLTGTVIAFLMIGIFNSCQDYKLSHKEKAGQTIKDSANEIQFEDIFTPAENSDYEIKEQPTVEKILVKNNKINKK